MPLFTEVRGKKGYSRKFAVASAPPSSAASAPERHGGNVLGSKRTYLVAFVAPLCSKALRLVTLQLPENSCPIGPGQSRTSRLRRSRKYATTSNPLATTKIAHTGDALRLRRLAS